MKNLTICFVVALALATIIPTALFYQKTSKPLAQKQLFTVEKITKNSAGRKIAVPSLILKTTPAGNKQVLLQKLRIKNKVSLKSPILPG